VANGVWNFLAPFYARLLLAQKAAPKSAASVCPAHRNIAEANSLNTSFNDREEPMVESPQDAVASFLKMNLDYLVIGNYITEKK